MDHCPLCDTDVEFSMVGRDAREGLRCPVCAERYAGSVVRTRGLYQAFKLFGIRPEGLRVHEIAPSRYGASVKLRQTVKRYTATNFWPDRPMGARFDDDWLNVNAEEQPFPNASFDLVVSLDVMEHVNHPDRVFAEIWRTLAPGGAYVCSIPTYPALLQSERAALYKTDGSIEHYEDPPEYHGGPLGKSLLTWRYGYDLPALIRTWADFDVTVLRFDAPHVGLTGAFTEIYVCQKH